MSTDRGFDWPDAAVAAEGGDGPSMTEARLALELMLGDGVVEGIATHAQSSAPTARLAEEMLSLLRPSALAGPASPPPRAVSPGTPMPVQGAPEVVWSAPGDIAWHALYRLTSTVPVNTTPTRAQEAVALLLGEESVRRAVDQVIGGAPGSDTIRLALAVIQPTATRRYCIELAERRPWTDDALAWQGLNAVFSPSAAPADLEVLQRWLEDDGWLAVIAVSAMDLMVCRALISAEVAEPLLRQAEKHRKDGVRQIAGWVRGTFASACEDCRLTARARGEFNSRRSCGHLPA